MPDIFKDISGDKIAVLRVEEFVLESATKFVVELTEIGHSMVDMVYVVINSDGGDTRAMYAILDAINNYTGPMEVCGIGTCGSSAAYLLFSITTQLRFAAPNTEFLLHECTVTSISKVGARKPTKRASLIRRKRLEKRFKQETDDKMIGLVAHSSGKSIEFVQQMIRGHDGEWTFSAQEALEYGFIDHIGVPFLNEDRE